MAAECLALLLALGLTHAEAQNRAPTESPWPLHIVDNSSSGADGAKLGDINGDGLMDIATGWEEGGLIRVYLNPGYGKAKSPWPAVTVGETPSPEDALFVDLDGDGALDVLSCCEGKTKCVFVNWAPKDPARILNADAWQTEPIPCTNRKSRWMFAEPMQVDGKNGVDLVVGSKGPGAMIGWLQSPADPRKLEDWKLHKLCDATWVMSIVPIDVDGDGDADLIIADRHGEYCVFWLENPGKNNDQAEWPKHVIGAKGLQVLFLDATDMDGDGKLDVLAAVRDNEIHWFRCPDDPKQPWALQVIKVQLPEGTGLAKGVRAGDLNGDGKRDIVFSCEKADKELRGVVWLTYADSPADETWVAHDVSGPIGIKYDLIQLLDLDGDGDLDVLTTEENEAPDSRGLGVIWHENPLNRQDGKKGE